MVLQLLLRLRCHHWPQLARVADVEPQQFTRNRRLELAFLKLGIGAAADQLAGAVRLENPCRQFGVTLGVGRVLDYEENIETAQQCNGHIHLPRQRAGLVEAAPLGIGCCEQ